MSWENRGNTSYYYRRRKVGGRMVTEYLGNDWLAELAAEQDDADRRQRQRAAAKWRAQVDNDRQTAAELAELDDLVKSAVAAVLIANGYHTHRRQWRKMRDE